MFIIGIKIFPQYAACVVNFSKRLISFHLKLLALFSRLPNVACLQGGYSNRGNWKKIQYPITAFFEIKILSNYFANDR